MKKLVILTGAGISAESGIPTFRGPEGYWTVGSKNYHPMEMAQASSFKQMPEEVWKWYLYRKKICENANPNRAHEIIRELENKYMDSFHLITQNVDNLHLRTGNSKNRTYEIHGNISYMRCSKDCHLSLYEIPEGIRSIEIMNHLCPKCDSIMRPHVLWFDEYYNDELFYFNQSLDLADNCEILITIGTSAATNLPKQFVSRSYSANAIIYDINPNENAFSNFAAKSGGAYLAMKASEGLEKLLNEGVI